MFFEAAEQSGSSAEMSEPDRKEQFVPAPRPRRPAWGRWRSHGTL